MLFVKDRYELLLFLEVSRVWERLLSSGLLRIGSRGTRPSCRLPKAVPARLDSLSPRLHTN